MRERKGKLDTIDFLYFANPRYMSSASESYYLVHILKAWIWRNNIVERKLVVFALSHLAIRIRSNDYQGYPYHHNSFKSSIKSSFMKSLIKKHACHYLWSYYLGDLSYHCFVVYENCVLSLFCCLGGLCWFCGLYL